MGSCLVLKSLQELSSTEDLSLGSFQLQPGSRWLVWFKKPEERLDWAGGAQQPIPILQVDPRDLNIWSEGEEGDTAM